MESERVQGYIASLEQIVRNTYFDLSEAINEFQEMCQRVIPERNVPIGIITDIRQNYKEIQDQLRKIRGINQLLEGKYRQYYRRNPLRQREIMEFEFLAKSLYSKIEYTFQGMEAKRKLKDMGLFEEHRQREPFPWFHSKENQMILLRNLQSLYELGYRTQSDLDGEQSREEIEHGMRSISLFALSGGVELIDVLQSRMRLREYDIKERYAKDHLRGALTHLREISLSEVTSVIRRFMDNSEFSKLKCLLFSIQSQKDLKKGILVLSENIMHGMGEGEVRTLPIWTPLS